MLDNGLGIYGMSHVSMNIIQQIHDEYCAIYQVIQVYAMHQSINMSIYQTVNNQWDHETKIMTCTCTSHTYNIVQKYHAYHIPEYLPMVIH